MPSPGQFFQELKARNVRKTMAIYLSSALTTLGILKLFIEAYGLTEKVFPVAVTLLTCGVVSAFVIAWTRGRPDEPRKRTGQYVLHALVAVIAVTVSYRVASTPRIESVKRPGVSIAVLPFKNMSGVMEDEYFSDGVMEDILTQLSKIGDLNVISRTSTMKYKNSTMGVREIAGELNVSAVLEGSVRRSGNRVRIVGQLIDATRDVHLWAETYDREFKDIFAIQTEVAQEIASALKAQLSPVEQHRIEKKATGNLDAYAFYLKGRDHYNRLTKEDNETAIEFFKKAIALDSTYALAIAGLADAFAQRYQRYGFDEQWVDSSISLSMHAVALDPELPEPRKSLGLAYYQKEWYGKAMEQNRIALELNPSFASVYSNMGELLDWTGHPDEAIPLIQKAMSLQPGRISDYIKLGSAYYSLNLDSLAAINLMKAIELQPTHTTSLANLAEVYAKTGALERARALLDSLLAVYPDDLSLLFTAGNVELSQHRFERARAFYQRTHDLSTEYFGLAAPLAFTLLRTGRRQEGIRMLDLCLQGNLKAIENQSEEGHRRYDLARVYAIKNDTLTALKWIEEAFARSSGFVNIADGDPLIENLARTEEFKRLMSVHRERINAMRERVLKEGGPS